MKLNVPYKIRAMLYIITAIGTPVMGVLTAEDIFADWAMTLWSAEVAVVSALAAFNTTPHPGEDQ